MRAVVALLFGLSACASAPGTPLRAFAPHAATFLTNEPRAAHEDARFTVVTFFSRNCACQRMHDARLRALYETFHPRGVRFVAIDSEVDSSPAADAEEARARGYPFPILRDADGVIADELGAEYATYTVILDARGHVRFHGGIDSDRVHETDDVRPYVRDALDALLRGEEPELRAADTLGCALRRK